MPDVYVAPVPNWANYLSSSDEDPRHIHVTVTVAMHQNIVPVRLEDGAYKIFNVRTQSDTVQLGESVQRSMSFFRCGTWYRWVPLLPVKSRFIFF